MRGGVSRGQSSRFFPGWSSPRAWGCFRFLRARYRRDRVFPTCVGVFPLSHWRPLCHSCLPHVRGGVSARVSAGRRKTSSSPRAWGCFFSLTDTRLLYRVFPTCVGVFLGIERAMDARLRLPHVRGGVSNSIYAWQRFVVSSPRAWGCFHFHQRDKRRGRVFPTCVGVFPLWL